MADKLKQTTQNNRVTCAETRIRVAALRMLPSQCLAHTLLHEPVLDVVEDKH
jgi:hypothetical protein